MHQNIGRALDSQSSALDKIATKVDVNNALIKKNTRGLKEVLS